MGQHTDIQWCDSTLNLQMGCAGCELWNGSTRRCYAGLLTQKYQGRKGWPEKFGIPKVFPERMKEAEQWKSLYGQARPDKPWLNGLPRIIFLNDMGDTFTEGLEPEWLIPFLERMSATPHTYLLLTKRPKRAGKFFETHACPDNVWVGTSITDANVGRVDALRNIKCATRFISYEPAWTKFDWIEAGVVSGSPDPDDFSHGKFSNIDWVIIGGESGLHTPKRFDVSIIRDSVPLLNEAGVKVFVKQLGSNPYDPRLKGRPSGIKDFHGGDWSEWPDAWKVRQMPSVKQKNFTPLPSQATLDLK